MAGAWRDRGELGRLARLHLGPVRHTGRGERDRRDGRVRRRRQLDRVVGGSGFLDRRPRGAVVRSRPQLEQVQRRGFGVRARNRGAPYDGVLGSFDNLANYTGTIAGKAYPTAPGRHFTILTGGTTDPGHPMQSSWPAGMYAASDQVVVNGGWEERGSDVSALWRAIDAGTISIGVRTLQFNLGEKSTQPDGWAVGDSGGPIDAAVDAMLLGLTADQRAKTHVIGFEQLVVAWDEVGRPAIAYDEATLH